MRYLASKSLSRLRPLDYRIPHKIFKLLCSNVTNVVIFLTFNNQFHRILQRFNHPTQEPDAIGTVNYPMIVRQR